MESCWRHTYLLWAVCLTFSIVCVNVCMTSAEWLGNLSDYDLARFDNPDVLDEPPRRVSKFNHFALSLDASGNLYVGGVNWLYRLNSALELKQNASTCDQDCHLESNLNKVLAVDGSNMRLITCGSNYAGTCQLRNLTNITEKADNSENVAGFGEATTVSLIAPQSTQGHLYVAVSYANEVGYTYIPPISRRELDLRTFYDQDTRHFRIFENPPRINYLRGFAHGGFTYFVAFQPDDTNPNTYVSKISRVCQDAPNLDAYTEISLQCSGSDGSVYSLVQAAHFGPAGPDLAASLALSTDEQVLYAVFAKNQGDVPIEHSALCVYRMTDILAGFREAVRGCIRNGSDYSVDYLQRSFCSSFSISILDRYFCIPAISHTPLFRYAKGIVPVPSTAVLELTGTLMSCIITSTEVNHTVAFIGTSTGDLLKVHIISNTAARLYERVPLDTSPVLTDIKIDEATRVMHVLTEQKLIKMRLENCGGYTTCETCIGTDAGNDGDPYCGWCTLQRRCTRYSDCPSPDVSTRWLAFNAAQCINITDVAPCDSLPITTTEQQITLSVQQLPDLESGQNYDCNFGTFESPATKNGEALQCTSPPRDAIPAIPQGDDAVRIILGVESSETSVLFVETDFYFYECSTHTSCVSCVGSRWACDWCVFENRCTHESSTCTETKEIIITGDMNPAASAVKGPGFCPQLLSQTAEVLLPNNIARSITVETKNLPDEARISSYQCSLDVEGSPQAVRAQRNGNTITCQGNAYTYLAKNPELEVKLSVSWTDMSGGMHKLDDIHGFNAILYKCEVQKPDCSRCVTARPELECVWCGAMPSVSGVCKLDETCSENKVTLDNGMNCPDPVLSEVFPLSGLIEGNTVIDVMGTDIGRSFSDVVSVMVGDRPCSSTGFSSEYRTGRSVSCRTEAENEGAELVTLTILGADGTVQQSSGMAAFVFKDPWITGFQPPRGPEAGGTAVSVDGTALNAGRYIQAFIGDNPCNITSNPNNTVLECTTPAGQVGLEGVVKISFDGAMRSSSDVYTYTENPTITGVSPLKSILSGGRILTVTGTLLNISRKRQIFATVGKGYPVAEECQRVSTAVMHCPSPSIAEFNRTLPVNFGFIMDGVTGLLTWFRDNGVELEYFRDPVYDKFKDDVQTKEGATLTITGEGINSAITAKEITVRIGVEYCVIILVSDTLLKCTLPMEAPAAGDYVGKDTERGLPVVWVQHGNLNIRLGYLIYPTAPEQIVAIVVLSVIIPLSLAMLIAATVKYCRHLKRKRTHDQRLLDRILEVHLEIESHVKGWQGEQNQSESARPKQKRIVLNNSVSFVPNDIHIEFSQLEMGETLGQGAFGRVLKAVLHDTSGEDQIVAVKTVQDTTDPKHVVKFLEEGLIMKSFDHVNVLGLLGLTFDTNRNPLVVIPFMANGDLKTYLIKKKKAIPTSLLMRFALHAALGMSYLAQHKFVHRDLAARNCMVDRDLVVKIADFGLSRDMQASDYYTSGDAQAKLPIKWMAPESMERRVYNARTDVWSYGVLLWEIFSKGARPYPGLPNQDVYDFLKSGKRMDAPTNCPAEIYGIMQRCWQDHPKSRITFGQVANELEGLLEGDHDYPGAPSASVAGRGPIDDHQEPGITDGSYLVPMQQETAFGMEGPCSDGETSKSNVNTSHDRSDYVNKSVIR